MRNPQGLCIFFQNHAIQDLLCRKPCKQAVSTWTFTSYLTDIRDRLASFVTAYSFSKHTCQNSEKKGELGEGEMDPYHMKSTKKCFSKEQEIYAQDIRLLLGNTFRASIHG